MNENTQTEAETAAAAAAAQESLEGTGGDTPPAEAEGKGNQTRYMVLMANVLQRKEAEVQAEGAEGEAIAYDVVEHGGYFELGWHTAWSPAIAKEAALAQARKDADDGNGKSELELQLESLGVLLRAIPQRSWAETVEPSDVYVPPAELRVR